MIYGPTVLASSIRRGGASRRAIDVLSFKSFSLSLMV